MKLKNACFVITITCFITLAHAQVKETGSTDYIPIWTGAATLGDSEMIQTDGKVAVGTKTPTAKLNAVSRSTALPAIAGNATATSGMAPGVFGTTASNTDFTAAISGLATASTGRTFAVLGTTYSPNGYGVFGNSLSTADGVGTGVAGVTNNNGSGVQGVDYFPGGNGVQGLAYATTGYAYGVQGSSFSAQGAGVLGVSAISIGVLGMNQSCSSACNLVPGTAGEFATGAGGLILQGLGPGYVQVFSVDSNGNLSISGNLSKGSGSFKIDHPLDPANKYLSHSFVESPDMMNIYNGVVVLDSKGEALVNLPDYFQALNNDFRYQLTAMGAPGPNLYVAEEISGNHFKIAGGRPGAKVSWQVTGVRQDAYAKAHRIQVEEDKPELQKGHYLHPELFGATEREAIGTANPRVGMLPTTAAEMSGAGGVR